MVKAQILDSRGNPISSERLKTGTNLISARNFLGGLPDADANLALLPMERRGVAGLVGLYREMMDTHVGISAAVYWAITEAASAALSARNRVRHPGFVPSSRPIEVLA